MQTIQNLSEVLIFSCAAFSARRCSRFHAACDYK